MELKRNLIREDTAVRAAGKVETRLPQEESNIVVLINCVVERRRSGSLNPSI